MSDRAKQIEAALIENPFLTSRQIGDRLGVTGTTVRSTVKHRLGMGLDDLRLEVFEGYYRRIEE